MKKIIPILKNPFSVIDEKKLFIAGVVSTIVGIFISYIVQIQMQILRLNTLDTPTITQVIFGNLIIISSLTIVFCILGKIINKKTRIIDILNVVTIALVPLYISLFQNINGFLTAETTKIENAVKDGTIYNQSLPLLLICITLIGLCFFVYYIYLLFIGFKTATNAKKAWQYALFFILLIAVDLLTSGLINSI